MGTNTEITVINSQNTQVYALKKGTKIDDDNSLKAELAKDSNKIGCLQSLGNIEETRSMTEYKCLTSNKTAKSLGSISRGSLDLELLLDPDDTAGQKTMRDAFKNNESVIFIVELSDKESGYLTGTMYIFTALISKVSTAIKQDAAVTYTVTVEVSSDIVEHGRILDL